MITGRPAEMEERLRLRLFVEAVGGVLPGVTAGEERPVVVRLTTGDGFRGEMVVGKWIGGEPRVHLHFWSDGDAVRMFEERWFVPPLPVGGWTGLGRLGGWVRGLKRVGAVLKETGERDESCLRWQFEAGLRAAVPVSEMDGRCGLLVKGCPEGLIRFRLGRDTLGPGLRVVGGKLVFEEGEGRGDAEVIFGSVEVLREGLDGKLDALAALGEGRLVVDGLVPLADGVNLVLERAGECLRSLG